MTSQRLPLAEPTAAHFAGPWSYAVPKPELWKGKQRWREVPPRGAETSPSPAAKHSESAASAREGSKKIGRRLSSRDWLSNGPPLELPNRVFDQRAQMDFAGIDEQGGHDSRRRSCRSTMPLRWAEKRHRSDQVHSQGRLAVPSSLPVVHILPRQSRRRDKKFYLFFLFFLIVLLLPNYPNRLNVIMDNLSNLRNILREKELHAVWAAFRS